MKYFIALILLVLNLLAAEENEVLFKYLNGTPKTECFKNVPLSDYIKKDDKGILKYYPELNGIDLKSGMLTYNIYEINTEFDTVEGTFGKPTDTISFVNPSCKFSTITETEFMQILQEHGLEDLTKDDLNSKNNKLIKDLQELEKKYLSEDAEFTQVGDQRYLTTASYLLACLTFNEKIIDIKKSLQLNKITLKPGYTIYPNQEIEKVEIKEVSKGFSSIASATKKQVETKYTDVVIESISEYLSENVILYAFDFRSRWDTVLLKLKTFLFLTFLPFTVGFLGLSKVTKKLSKITDFDDVYEKIIMAIGLLVIFYFTNGTKNLVEKTEDIEVNMHLSKYQNFAANFFDKTMTFSNESSNIFSSSYINFKRKSAGYLSEKEIINITGDTASAIKQKKTLESIYGTCGRDWNIDLVRVKFNITTKKDVMNFPSPRKLEEYLRIDPNTDLPRANNILALLNVE